MMCFSIRPCMILYAISAWMNFIGFMNIMVSRFDVFLTKYGLLATTLFFTQTLLTRTSSNAPLEHASIFHAFYCQDKGTFYI